MESIEHFLALPEEKQHKIIDAGLGCFGKNGYKKASVSDIAKAAGISKAMIFYYFGNKKNMYLYLSDFCVKFLAEGVIGGLNTNETDFFERIKIISTAKLSISEQYPDVMTFIESVYFETDSEVENEIKQLTAQRSDIYNLQKFFEGVDYSKFKSGINPALVIKLLTRFTEGYIREKSGWGNVNKAEFMREFDECLMLFKNNFYKK